MTDSPSTSQTPPEIPVPSGTRIRGRLRVPSSKSLTHRYFNLAVLARAPLVVEHPLVAEDTRLFLEALGRLGFRVTEEGEAVRLERLSGNKTGDETEILCGNAGTMLRFLVATLTVVPGIWRLDGVARLRERPVRPLVDALRRLGARIDYLGAEGYVPLRLHGGTLGAGTTVLDAGESSPYLSALLMAALRAPGPVTVEVEALTSRPYVDVTLGVVAAFGGHIEEDGEGIYRVRPSALDAGGTGRVAVEGDWSAAAYPAAAAALTGGTVVLDGLVRDSRQGDRGFLALLEQMGAAVSWNGNEVTIQGNSLQGIEADLSSMPDQVPTLAALAPFARGTTRIFNVAHLRIKESDRLDAMATELRKAGATVEEGPDWLRIPGIWADAEPPATAVRIDPRGDHRIAMSLALVGLRRPGIIVTTPDVVGKSYPGFWRDLQRLTEART
ncbi:MAG TPA: 3-phosphoshikimate 1-carboxyvinyltransferase [Thermoanaerobaculia bacterium]